MKKSIFLLLLVFIGFASRAQYVTLSGYIRDQATGEALIGASIYVPNKGVGTTSNVYGFYSLTLPEGEHVIAASYVGFREIRDTLPFTHNFRKDFNLETEILQEVELIEKRTQDIRESTQMSKVDIPLEKIDEIPVFMGEQDILKIAQLMPGIQSGTEGTSGLFVRGGSPDQNLILLDGVPVYNANHLFGFFSVFNPDAIQSVDIYKGGFPARYGGRLSSVIDVRMKEGNEKEFNGKFSIGNVASKINLEGPIIKGKSSFNISARRTYIDFLSRPLIRLATGGDETAGYYFQDLNAKLNYRIGEKHRVYLSIYYGDDKAFTRLKFDEFDVEENAETELTWGNITGSARWNWEMGPKLFSNFTFNLSNYDMLTGYNSEYVEDGETYSSFFEYTSGIRDVSIKHDIDYIPSPQHYIRTGYHVIYHTFNPGVNQFSSDIDGDEFESRFGNEKQYATEMSLFIEDDWRVGDRWKVNIGGHFSAFNAEEEWFTSFQPRISGRYLINDVWSAKASYSTMAQFIHLLSNTGIGLPTDLWLPATQRVRPMTSNQTALGLVYKPNKTYEFSLEGYYKHMQNVIEYRNGASFFSSDDWQNLVVSGMGWAYGLEFLARKDMGKFTGWIGYTLAWSWRKFDELNDGKAFPYRYDRRHDISITGVYRINEKISLGMVWVYGTGNAVSIPVATYPAIENAPEPGWPGYSFNNLEYYESRNGYRMPDYHRLDLSYNHTKTTKGGNKRMLSVGVYNAYSRINPFFLYFEDQNSDGQNELYKIGLFPIIPYITYKLHF